jgi:DNA repair protein RadA/Sms
MAKVQKLHSRLQQINTTKFEDGLFEEHKTDTPLDGLFSIGGGVPKATNYMVVGDPGVGKSTVTLDVIANAKKNGSKVLFISAEMSPVDLKLYVDRYPKFGDLDIFFPQTLEEEESPKAVLEEVLNEGYDIVLIDSFIELQATIQEADRMTRNSAEKWLLNLMYQHNLGDNKGKHFTSFLAIQQVNKGGTFVGSNKLKHMTTGMMEIRFVDQDTQEERYVVFSKNRRGHVGKRMFFNLAATGDVTYDTERFKKNEELQILKKKEAEKLKEGASLFEDFIANMDTEKTSNE